MDEITVHVKLDRTVTVGVNIYEVIDVINDLPMTSRWNYLANILNKISVEKDGLNNDQKMIVKEFLEKKLELFQGDKLIDEIKVINRLKETVGDLSSKMQEGRHYLMGVEPENLTVEDALEAFGFGRNGLKNLWEE